MIFTVQVKIMPLKSLLDPQGKAVNDSLKNLDLHAVKDVRVGKNIQLQVDAKNKEEAIIIAEKAAKELLANPVMESFEIEVIS